MTSLPTKITLDRYSQNLISKTTIWNVRGLKSIYKESKKSYFSTEMLATLYVEESLRIVSRSLKPRGLMEKLSGLRQYRGKLIDPSGNTVKYFLCFRNYIRPFLYLSFRFNGKKYSVTKLVTYSLNNKKYYAFLTSSDILLFQFESYENLVLYGDCRTEDIKHGQLENLFEPLFLMLCSLCVSIPD